MSDLADFLLARIAEDEAVARSIDADPRRVARNWGAGMRAVVMDRPWQSGRDRLLAECEAKRRIVELHEREPVPLIAEVCPRCRAEHLRDPYSPTQCAQCGSECDFEEYLGPLLALPYAAHPDFREEWRR